MDYDGILLALDALEKALNKHKHSWTKTERKLYEDAVAELTDQIVTQEIREVLDETNETLTKALSK